MFSKFLLSAFWRLFVHHAALSVRSRLKSQHIHVLFRPPWHFSGWRDDSGWSHLSRCRLTYTHTFSHTFFSFSSPQQPVHHWRERKKKTGIHQNPVSCVVFQSKWGLNSSVVMFSALENQELSQSDTLPLKTWGKNDNHFKLSNVKFQAFL